MNDLDKKLNKYFGPFVVRKDLTQKVKGNAVVPIYVLEYLLGQHCSTDNEHIINQGIERVKGIINAHFVHRNESERIKSLIKEKEEHSIIDKISIRLNDRKDRYEMNFTNLGLRGIPVSGVVIKNYPKMLSGGVWSKITMGYSPIISDESYSDDLQPWTISNVKPIQIPYVHIEKHKELRKEFTTKEWIDILLQSMGLNPKEFNRREKLIQICRLVPFVENNYNLIELGPKGTGKSHVLSELSPHGILLSGGEVTKAKLFIDNRYGKIGLVGYWDVVAYDEFAGKGKKIDQALVDIMKNYMANKSFSRGTEVFGASASMVFVGNTDYAVKTMVNNSNLFTPLPQNYYNTAFLDRIHCYLPGWEVQKLRNEMFAKNYGFNVDYLAEILKELRKEDRTNDLEAFCLLSDSITTRDKTSIAKTFSGLFKIIYPHKIITLEEAQEIINLSIECRRRVKDQLRKMDETFEEVNFSYYLLNKHHQKINDQLIEVITPEELQFSLKYRYNKTNKDNESMDDKDLEFVSSDNKLLAPDKISDKGMNECVKHEIKTEQGEKGISYEKILGKYFDDFYQQGIKSVKIFEPNTHTPQEQTHLMEFMQFISAKTPYLKMKNNSTESLLPVHLITIKDQENEDKQRDFLNDFKESLTFIGIQFSFELFKNIPNSKVEIGDQWIIQSKYGIHLWDEKESFSIFQAFQEARQARDNVLVVTQEKTYIHQ